MCAVKAIEPKTEKQSSQKTRLEENWFVLLHDDQEHSYDYVIIMLVILAEMKPQDALKHAIEVDTDKVTIVGCKPRDEAENLAHQIMRFGGDPFLGTSCSMKATIEPANG